MSKYKYVRVLSRLDEDIKGYRFIKFYDDEHGSPRSEKLNLVSILTMLAPPTASWWRVYKHEDGKRWKLTRADWDTNKEEIVLKGVSLCYLCCWVAKHYRDQYLDVGCFVEEVSL